MDIKKFKDIYENPHKYLIDWKKRTGKNIIGFFCTYTPEEIIYAFDILPIRILPDSGNIDITSPHIFDMFCPLCKNVLNQILLGRYHYLDGLITAQSCLHLRQSYTSSDIHRNPGWSHYICMPNHVQSPRSIPFLKAEYEILIKKLEELTGKKICDSDLIKGIKLLNKVRKLLKDIYQFRKIQTPPITGVESIYLCCSQFLMDANQWLEEANKFKEEIKLREEKNIGRKRIMIIGNESPEIEFLNMVEDVENAVVVIEDSCITTRYFWEETEENYNDPLNSIAKRYVLRSPCPSKDWPNRNRTKRILEFAKDFFTDGVILLRQRNCTPHGQDHPFIKRALEKAGYPVCVIDLEPDTPVDIFEEEIEDFLENL